MNDQLADLQARYDRLKSLYQVGNVIHSTLDSQEALQLILNEAVRLMKASSGSVVLINPTTGFLEILASHGLPPEGARLQLQVGEGITGWVARTGRAARVDDVTRDPRYVLAGRSVRSELAVPLEVNGEVRGVLNVDSDRLQAFSPEDQQLLEDLAVQAAKVILNTWLYEQIRVKARLFESLVSVSQTINSTLSLDETLKVVTRESCQLMGAKMSSLLMLDPTGEWLELRASHGAGPDYLSKPHVNVAESLVGIVVRRKKPIQVLNVQTSNRYQNVEVARLEGLVSLLSVPLLYSGGQVMGTLSVYTGWPHSFSNEEIQILSALAELSAIALDKARLYERLVEMEEALRESEKLSALGLLAAEVAHEIRNPLTVMKMMFHSLDLQFLPEDPRSRDAQIMSEKMEHLNRIVEQILAFARNTEPQFSRVNLNQVLDDVRLLTRHKLGQQQIQWINKLDPNLPPVMADATQLEQAFLNLILNAAEAMPQGGKLTVAARVLPSARTKNQPASVCIDFKDTGQGMTEDQRRRAFSSLLNSTKRHGTGLGLAIVSRVVEAHHGKVNILSKPGRGTTIRITLPVQREE